MGIRPFVAIRQDISQSAPNILESQMNPATTVHLLVEKLISYIE